MRTHSRHANSPLRNALRITFLACLLMLPEALAFGQTFAPTGTMSTGRFGQTETLLPSGMVLITGGDASGSSAELYDPATGSFTPTELAPSWWTPGLSSQ